MEKIATWKEAQKVESEFWDGMIMWDQTILRVLADNAEKAAELSGLLPPKVDSSLEVGIGPFGLGISGFLRQIVHKHAIDPLPPVDIDRPDDPHPGLTAFLRERREEIRYVVACGEEIPFSNESMDLVICCNVIDHASDPRAILSEIRRILKPGGIFFFDVHTFSVLGLAKWHTWTKRVHKDDVLVTAHPYRMFERDVVRQLRSCGFAAQKIHGQSLMSSLIGHARASAFLASRLTE